MTTLLCFCTATSPPRTSCGRTIPCSSIGSTRDWAILPTRSPTSSDSKGSRRPNGKRSGRDISGGGKARHPTSFSNVSDGGSRSSSWALHSGGSNDGRAEPTPTMRARRTPRCRNRSGTTSTAPSSDWPYSTRRSPAPPTHPRKHGTAATSPMGKRCLDTVEEAGQVALEAPLVPHGTVNLPPDGAQVGLAAERLELRVRPRLYEHGDVLDHVVLVVDGVASVVVALEQRVPDHVLVDQGD